MRLGVNVPNFGPGTNPDVLRRWARQEFDALETAHPETAWQAQATVAERWNQQESKDIDAERS